jgi:hypothetical protein
LNFDKGKYVVKLSKYPLCASSRYFKNLLDGPFSVHPTSFRWIRNKLIPTVQPGQVLTVRLRDDFSYAVRVMVEFIESENYTFKEDMKIGFPTMTMLDLHIHAYLIGIKYSVLKLANLAIKRYIDLGNMCLHLKSDPNCRDETPFMALNREQVEGAELGNTAIVRSFLVSLAFLWKNTRDRKDVMRTAVLKLLKHHYTSLMKVPFFGELKREVKDLEKDLIESLAEDGVQVKTYRAKEGEKAGVRFG